MASKKDIDLAVYYLKLALPEMSKRAIPTTPENYAVWYEYTVGQNTGLVYAINDLISSDATFSDDINQNLYDQFIAQQQHAAVHHLRDGVRQIIHNLLSQLTNEGSGLHDYAQSLENFASEMRNSTEIGDIKALIASLLEETRKREESTLGLQATLDNMAEEVHRLRAEVERLNEEASTDALTRVSNRRAFDINLDKAISQAKMQQLPLTLIILDIDYFKRFSDKFGHIVGDKVLRFVASALKKNVKGNDTVARFGGEEFAIVLPDTPRAGAAVVAEQIRERIATQKLSDSAENIKLGNITVSLGVAEYREHESAEELIRRADQCLYQAKHEGRNRVVTDQNQEAETEKEEILL